jgi:hypothetical protein
VNVIGVVRKQPQGIDRDRLEKAARARARLRPSMLTALFAVALTGCGASIGADNVETGTLTLPSLPAIETFDFTLPPGQRAPVGPPSEIYARVARGILTCWMGAHGSLKKTHVFHASSEPARKGGKSLILLHERDDARPASRGRQSVRVQIAPEGNSASIGFRNLTLDEADAARLKTDVYRWAANHEGCLPDPVKEGWQAQAQKKETKKNKARN